MAEAAPVEAALDELRALCSGSFGPCGAQTLLFRPPDAPVVTGSGYAVLAAWKEAADARHPRRGGPSETSAVAPFVLSAVDGLHQEAGDGASELVLLLHSAVKHASLYKTPSDGAHRRQLSRALGALKWTLWDELAEADTRGAYVDKLRVPVDIELERVDGPKKDGVETGGRRQPTGEFRRQLSNVLRSALGGLFGPDAREFLVSVVVEWFFRAAWPSAEIDARMMRQRVQEHLKRASDAVMFLTSSSLSSSSVLSPDDFILRQSVVGVEQQLGLSDALASTTDGDAARSFLSRYLYSLSTTHGVRLLICSEPIREDVVATSARFGISCVQFAEPNEVTALGIASGTIALASLFDAVVAEKHIGQCRDGVSLLLHAPSKGIYKQYYAAIVKALRVLRSWFKPSEDDAPTRLYVCRGAGIAELVIARLLVADKRSDLGRSSPSDASRHEDQYARQARRIVADALLEVVALLQQNLERASGGGTASANARRRVLALLATPSSQCSSESFSLRVLDEQHRIKTKAGVVACPQVVRADPKDIGLVHPWARTEAVLFQMLSTLEQLFRIDAVVHIKRVKPLNNQGEIEEEEEDLYE